jgi:hypothetical protein
MRKGSKHSEETKEKMSKSHLSISDETRRKLSEALSGEENPMYGRKHSEETREKMSNNHRDISGENNPNFGKKHSEETKRKIADANKGEKSCKWKGGVSKLNIPLFGTYAHQIEKYEEIRKTEEGYLEVRCTYCGKWYTPKMKDVVSRITAINSSCTAECRLYCSQGCKKECPVFGKRPETLIKQDAIRAGLIKPEDLNREVQPELRWLVLERDNYTCQRCGCTHSLHCHHYEGIWQNRLMSADVDMCITLCKHCHLKAHQQPGCSYYDMRRKAC